MVTGAAGFIGGHLTESLVRAGAHVRAFLRYNSRGSAGTLGWFDPPLLDDVEAVFGDLRDVESVRQACEGREFVFHLGAQIAIPYSYINPRDFFETNVLGSLNVAQAALEHGVSHLIHVSTSEVYGTAQQVPIAEDHPLEVQSPYAASKLAADKLMDSFHRTFELPMTIVRPFNTFGPHQSARAIVPTIITQALASSSITLGSLEPRRDLTFVTDTVAGLAAAVSPGAVGRTIQLGTGHDVSIGELVSLVADILGRRIEVQVDDRRIRPPGSEVQRLISSPALAERLLGWRPEVPLREGLERTMRWIEANIGRYQIGRYAV